MKRLVFDWVPNKPYRIHRELSFLGTAGLRRLEKEFGALCASNLTAKKLKIIKAFRLKFNSKVAVYALGKR
jgi:hypothetical protein